MSINKLIFINIVILLLVQCSDSNKNSVEQEAETEQEEKHIPYLDLELKKIEETNELNGLWTIVKKTRDYQGTTCSADFYEEELYFSDGHLYKFEYPCSRSDLSETILLKNDSLYCIVDTSYTYKYQSMSGYRSGFIEDTLVLIQNRFATYYVRKEFNEAVANILIKNELNPDCINGIWELESMTDYACEKIYVENIPNQIEIVDYSSADYFVKNDTLFSKRNASPIFHYIQLDWSPTTKKWILVLLDATKNISESNYYEYHLIKPYWKTLPTKF